MEKTLIYDVNDKPKFKELLVFAFQQVLAVLAATIAVPTIIGLPIQIPAAILGAGIASICYLFFTKFKSPVIISSSFAFLAPLANAIAFGYMGIVLGAIFSGLVYVVIALVIKFIGTSWVKKLMPGVIIGPTVTLIGLSLAGSAVGDLVKASGSGMSYNLVGIFCGLVTFATVCICSVQKKSKGLSLIPFVVGIGAGYVVASLFTAIGYIANVDYLKIVNFNALVENFAKLKSDSFGTQITAFFSFPKIGIVEGIKELVNGEVSREILEAFVSNTAKSVSSFVPLSLEMSELSTEQLRQAVTFYCRYSDIAEPTLLSWTGVATVALAFIPVAFVTFAEHVADHVNLGTIINKDLLNDEPGLSRTLLGDGVGSMVGTVFGICPNTTYGESVGCVAITKNASIRTILTASVMLIVLSFISPITALLRTIPNCVMGGVCLALYGFIAVSGLKMFKDVDLGDNKNLFTVAVILIAGIGGLVINIPIGGTNYIQITSIATGLILGIITYNICLKIEKK